MKRASTLFIVIAALLSFGCNHAGVTGAQLGLAYRQP
jgi:hypothetical protein